MPWNKREATFLIHNEECSVSKDVSGIYGKTEAYKRCYQPNSEVHIVIYFTILKQAIFATR